MEQMKSILGPYAGWIILAGVLLFLFRDQINFGAIFAWLWGRVTAPSTKPSTAPASTDYMGAYATLRAKLASSPDGSKALQAVWPYLEPGTITQGVTQ